MIHCAIMGSIERFSAVLIEHLGGNFPLWLSPVQLKLATVTEKVASAAQSIVATLKAAGIRVELDDSNKTLGKKSAEARNEKVPYFGILGEREVETNQLTLKNRAGEQQTLSLDTVISLLQAEIASKK